MKTIHFALFIVSICFKKHFVLYLKNLKTKATLNSMNFKIALKFKLLL